MRSPRLSCPIDQNFMLVLSYYYQAAAQIFYSTRFIHLNFCIDMPTPLMSNDRGMADKEFV